MADDQQQPERRTVPLSWVLIGVAAVVGVVIVVAVLVSREDGNDDEVNLPIATETPVATQPIATETPVATQPIATETPEGTASAD